jgi:hypothetical protein
MKKICLIALLIIFLNNTYAHEDFTLDIADSENEYSYIIGLEKSLRNLLENAEKKNEIIMQFILQKLHNDDENILENLPFLLCDISNDGIMKIYKWNATQSGDNIYHSIVVYNNNLENVIIPMNKLVSELTALPLNPFIPDNKWEYLDYEFVDRIKDEQKNIYILRGNIAAGEGFHFYGYIGLEVNNNEIKLSELFNGKKQIGFKMDCLIGREFNNEYLVVDVITIRTELYLRRPFRIIVLLARMNETNDGLEYKTVTYLYNNGEIVGDYNILNNDNIWE